MDIKNRIELAKLNLGKAEKAQTIAQTQKQAAEQQLEEIKGQMTAEGVTPETITAEITKLEAQVEADVTKVEGLIPKV
jgi:chromosome segregation ATPase